MAFDDTSLFCIKTIAKARLVAMFLLMLLRYRYPSMKCVVYTGDIGSSAEEILSKAEKTFGISLPLKIEFVFLHRRAWVEAKRYPVLTLLGQSLGSMILGLEALIRHPPDIFIDTMG